MHSSSVALGSPPIARMDGMVLAGTVKPDYQGTGILNLISSIQLHFGLKSKHSTLHQGFHVQQKLVLFIVDGLGHQQLQMARQKHALPAMEAMQDWQVLTSVFPSATMAALTTLHTGEPPSETGWLSGCLWLEEVGSIVNLVRGRDEFTRKKLDFQFMQHTPSVYQQLAAKGVKSTVIFPGEFLGSHLSNWHHRGAHEEGYFFTPNAIPTLVQRALLGSDYVVVYYPHYDDMCHRFNPASPEAQDEIQGLDSLLKRVQDRLPSRTTFLLTADHGHKTIEQHVWLDQHTDLHPHLLRPVSGEKVARYVHVRPGHRQTVQDHLSKWADVVSSTQLWEEGYFGGPPAQQTFLSRTGDLVAHTRNLTELNWTYHPDTNNLKGWGGNHGGLSETEMLVPLGILQT